MKKNLTCIVLVIMLLVGAVTDAVLLINRAGAEMDDRRVAAAVFWEDIVYFEDETDLSRDEWLALFAESGVEYAVFTSAPEADALAAVKNHGLSPAAYGNLEGDWAFVMPNKEEPLGDIGSADLIIMKNAYRTSTVVPVGFDIESYDGTMIKGVYMYKGYSNRYEDGIRGEEIENLLFRAITDRGARLLLLRPIMYRDLTVVTDPTVYSEVLSNVAKRIVDRGYSFGDGYSTIEAEPMPPLTLWLSGLVPLAVWLFLATRFDPLKRFGLLLCALGLAGTGVCVAIMPDLSQKILALSSVLGFAFCWVRFLHCRFVGDAKAHRLNPFVSYIILAAATLGWAFLCGLSVAAIQTELSYLMGETIFSGVKVSMMLPLVVCGIVFALPILRRIIKRDYTKRELLAMLPAALIILAAMAVLIYRSGDTMKEISEFENRMRVAFEYAFYVRPRTKELFFAVPFMSLLFIPGLRRDSMLKLIGALCCTLECVSVSNTFCHGLAPLHVSLIRGSLAAGMGAVLGLIVLAVFLFIWKKGDKFLRNNSEKGGDEG